MARKLAEVSNSAPTSEELSAQVATLREDVATLTNLLGDFTKAKGEQVTEATKETFSSIRDESKARASAATDAASKQVTELQGQANDFVKNQPGTALGVAAGIGFLVGFMSGRK